MNFISLIFCFALIMAFMHQMHAEEGAGDCLALDCDPKEYKPVCGGLDVESSQGFVNECALQMYNCLHETEWVVQTEVECEVASSDSASGYQLPTQQGGAGDCLSLDCDAKEYKPICGGLDVESSQGFVNECALQMYNCLHETEWVVQTEVECEVAYSESASGYQYPITRT